MRGKAKTNNKEKRKYDKKEERKKERKKERKEERGVGSISLEDTSIETCSSSQVNKKKRNGK